MESLLARVAVLSAAALTLGACGGTGTIGASGQDGQGGQGGQGGLQVVAAFYPLQFVAERVGGDAVQVTNLTAPGAEPHDLELTPREVASVADADLVVYLAGFQPAVDTAAADQAGERAFDVSSAARLDLHGEEDGHEEGTHEGDAGSPEHTGVDPHFWLDPTRLADVADSLAQRLSAADPEQASGFQARAEQLRGDLETLDEEFRTGLADCADRNLVTSHEAFGYLAQRYGLEQVGITGLSPEAEPDAATIARVADFVRANEVRTIYYETLVSPDVARTVAAETGAETAVLDPIEGISDASAARDYLGVMRADLAALRAGQPCS